MLPAVNSTCMCRAIQSEFQARAEKQQRSASYRQPATPLFADPPSPFVSSTTGQRGSQAGDLVSVAESIPSPYDTERLLCYRASPPSTKCDAKPPGRRQALRKLFIGCAYNASVIYT